MLKLYAILPFKAVQKLVKRHFVAGNKNVLIYSDQKFSVFQKNKSFLKLIPRSSLSRDHEWFSVTSGRCYFLLCQLAFE